MTDQLDPESRARLAAAVAAAEADAMLREAADYERWRARAEQAEAAIERVRAVAAELPTGYARRIREALDGTQQPGEELRERARAAAVEAWEDLLVPRPEQPAEPGDTR